MSSLVITKQTGNFFSLVLDGGSPIISEQNRLTTIGNLCNFIGIMLRFVITWGQ